jgi:hypothetical protein
MHASKALAAVLFLTIAMQVSAREEIPEPPRLRSVPLEVQPPASNGAREDTLFLFAASGPGSFGSPGTDARGFTFDHEGGPADAGWFGVDKTGQDGEWWHLASTTICAGTSTDMSQALPFDTGDTVNDYALWCGRSDVCGWVDPNGYGSNWRQYAVIDLSAYPAVSEVVIDFAYRSDFEGDNYDWFEVRVDSAGVWKTVQRDETSGDQTYRELSFTIPAAEFGGGATRIGFYFESDGAWSDEDGLYDSDIGAVWIDNIVASVDGAQVFAADFEDGLLPAEIGFETPPGAGNLAALRNENFQEDPDTINDSYAWTFYDPALANEDYPDGIIPFGPPYVQAAVQSPWLEVDQYGEPLVLGPDDRVLVEYQMYGDQPGSGLVFIAETPFIATRRDDGCEGPFTDSITTYWPSFSGNWYPWLVDMTLYVHDISFGGVVTGISVQLWVEDMCDFWCDTYGSGEPHTCAPYYDNVRVMVIREDLTTAEYLPAATGLLSAHPNPFNPKTSIRYALTEAGQAQLTVHDLSGRQVRELLNGPADVGEHSLEWNGRDQAGHGLASGVYLLRFEALGISEHRKLILLK